MGESRNSNSKMYIRLIRHVLPILNFVGFTKENDKKKQKKEDWNQSVPAVFPKVSEVEVSEVPRACGPIT